MNARGKRLSRFDTFKSDLESKLTKIGNFSIIDKWKKEIDNNFRSILVKIWCLQIRIKYI